MRCLTVSRLDQHSDTIHVYLIHSLAHWRHVCVVDVLVSALQRSHHSQLACCASAAVVEVWVK